MSRKRKDLIKLLLKGIETGDAASVAVVNPEKYIQHNPQTHEGGEGLAALFKRLAMSHPRVNVVRIFSDGDFVFGHTEYEFDTSRVGFEIFRFEGDLTVEHWDNIQPRLGPNSSGYSMVDGETEVCDHDKTEANREIVKAFVADVFINNQLIQLEQYINESHYIDHNPQSVGGLQELRDVLSTNSALGSDNIKYEKMHHILAEGNFVLTVCEGFKNTVHTSFFDLYRLADGKIIEHWDTREAVPPLAEWKNNNGKF